MVTTPGHHTISTWLRCQPARTCVYHARQLNCGAWCVVLSIRPSWRWHTFGSRQRLRSHKCPNWSARSTNHFSPHSDHLALFLSANTRILFTFVHFLFLCLCISVFFFASVVWDCQTQHPTPAHVVGVQLLFVKTIGNFILFILKLK